MTIFQVSHKVRWATVPGSEVLDSVMRWTSQDPLAVKVTFADTTGEVSWFFGRELLASVVMGRCAIAGEGDVILSKHGNYGMAGGSKDQLLLTLSVEKQICLRADLMEVRDFLEASFGYVAEGQEVVDVDAALVKLLDGGWESNV